VEQLLCSVYAGLLLLQHVPAVRYCAYIRKSAHREQCLVCQVPAIHTGSAAPDLLPALLLLPGTIISHNVPPSGRAGLYKQLAAVKDLVAEFREGGAEAGAALKGPIIEALSLAGLQQDCPYTENEGGWLQCRGEAGWHVRACVLAGDLACDHASVAAGSSSTDCYGLVTPF
jgi:hypothetical protein